jgi:toxin FitB
MYLLGTDVLLEMLKKEPCPSVINWCSAMPSEQLYVSVLSIGVLRSKIESSGSLQQRSLLLCWVKSHLIKWFDENILPVDIKVAERWSDLFLFSGYKSAESLVAATAIEKNLILVTSEANQNIEGLKVFDPFI